MITGYFYFDVEEKNGETRQIKKIFKLVLEANVLYLLWDSFYAVLSRNMSFLLDTFTIENVLKFIAFNESPLKGHLWYLGAILYAVVCAVYNYEDHATEFQLIENREERDKSIGSKYMQSKPGKIYKIAEDWLINHPEKRLLFVGMGCQADGFRKFAEMKGFRERVWIVDIICHGSPSPRLWKEYAESAEKKYGKITYLTFKDKRNGWKAPTAYVTAGGQEHLIKDYVKVFYNQCALRLSCYECPYATTERKTDMTIGDFWHIEETIPDFYDEKGNSIFLIHTDRGEQLFETVKVKLEYRLSDTKQCWQANLEAPTKRSEQRDEFWNDYQRKGVDFVMKKYGTTPLKTKIKNKLVKLISIGGGQTLNPDLIYYVDYSERRAA